MKNLKKLVIASFMLVIAFVAVVSSTYAWFTSSSEGKVNDITIGVKNAEKSLLISKTVDDVANAQWTKSLNYSFGKQKYAPVTLRSNNGAVDKFYELMTDDELFAYYDEADFLIDQNNTATTEGYVKLDITFQIDAAEKDLANSTIAINLVNLHAFKAVEDTESGEMVPDTSNENVYALSSFRIMFVDANEIAALWQGTRDADASDASDVVGTYGAGHQFRLGNAWMGRYGATGAGHEFVEGNVALNPQPTIVAPFVEQGASDWQLKQEYTDDAYANTETFDESATTVDEYEIDTFYSDYACTSEIQSLTGVKTAYAHIVVYVWMEGWDGDCENVASGCFYRFGLVFEVK